MSHDKLVALVTGGNRGIGYELVKQLALKGFKVILASRDLEMGQESAQTYGVRSGCFVCRDGCRQSRMHSSSCSCHK